MEKKERRQPRRFLRVPLGFIFCPVLFCYVLFCFVELFFRSQIVCVPLVYRRPSLLLGLILALGGGRRPPSPSIRRLLPSKESPYSRKIAHFRSHRLPTPGRVLPLTRCTRSTIIGGSYSHQQHPSISS